MDAVSPPRITTTAVAAPAAEAQLLACVVSLREGNASALATIYDALAPRLLAAATAILDDGDDADDVVAEVFQALWLAPERYDPQRSPLRAWMLLLTRSRALDLLRKRRRQQAREVHPQQLDTAYLVDAHADPVARLCEDQASARIEWALRTLREQPREVLRLALLEDLSHSEVAERLGLPLGTVKSHCRRGLQQLRRHLQPEPAAPETVNRRR